MRSLFLPAVALSVTACSAAFPNAPPIGRLQPVPVSDVDAWVAALRPSGHTTLRFHWTANQDNGGSGSVGIAAPDSLKLAYRGPLGVSPGEAFVSGDSAVWAEPRADVEKLVPSYELLWGLVGVARPPHAGWKVDGHRDATATIWRYTRGADTTQYVLWRADGVENLQTYVIMGGRPVGKALARFDASHHVIKSQLISLADPARLDIAFYQGNALLFDREMWSAPRP